ncbi:MAG: FHA domain-containing protein [Candidatus Saccharimonas sp.]|nr:FHA domain-containing protein [Planctomycetaceae bacterium]
MSAFLVPLDPGLCLIPLEKAIVLIGRQADCDVSLTHSRKVSRKHCCVAQVNDTFVVRDLGSTNGVFVNGSRVRKEAGLTLGDELAIGDVRFRLSAEAPSSKIIKKNGDGVQQNYDDPAVAQQAARPIPAVPVDMNSPVALPEMGQDFAVEPSIPHMRSLKRKKPGLDADLSLMPYEPEDDVVPLASDSL